MKPFHTYRDGNPPTPGVFATADSVYTTGSPVQIGDLIINAAVGQERGLVVGIYGNTLAYLIMESSEDEGGSVGDFFFCGIDDARCVGHAHYPLREVIRIEAEAVNKLPT